MNSASKPYERNVLLLTLDTLRYDVACDALHAGLTPNLAAVIPNRRWEERETPATFTYAAHQAFFAGFLPTPLPTERSRERLFAARFEGSVSTGPATLVFDTPDVVTGYASLGHHTVCVGGVGFFNKKNPLGSVLPSLFAESHWSEEMGVTSVHSTEMQIACAVRSLESVPSREGVFLFINVSALHQPNCIFTPGATADSPATQRNALAYVDRCLSPLFDALRARERRTLCVVCSDHGTAYGEDGYHGHRVAHPTVWRVPYAQFEL